MAHKMQCSLTFKFACLLILINVSNGFNLGLISGDLKRTLNPLIVKKNSNHAPVTINIKSGLPLSTIIHPVLAPKLYKKPPFIKTKDNALKTKLLKLRKIIKKSKLTKKPKLPKIPKIPKLPLLPILPPLLPPIIPKIPLLPLLPILPPLPLTFIPPILPKLPKVRKLLRIPIIGKSGLKALGSEIKPVKVPAPNLRRTILEKLIKLRKDGSLTTPEFIRFKKILL